MRTMWMVCLGGMGCAGGTPPEKTSASSTSEVDIGPGASGGEDADADTGSSEPTTDPAADGDGDGDGVAAADDCDDGDPAVHPGATEVCDGVDNDCDPLTSEDGLVTADGVTYSSVADAAVHASVGAEVVVCAGTYVETVYVDHPVWIHGVGSSEVTIDGDGQGTTVVVAADGVTLEGLTVTGGLASDGGGVRLNSGNSGLALVDVTLAENSGSYGGGLFLDTLGAITTLERVTMTGNDAGFGGGLYDGGDQVVVCTDCTFSDDYGVVGGAVYLAWSSELIATTSSFIGNESGSGGALYLATLASAEVTDGWIEGNNATLYGGALYLSTDATLELVRTSILTNTATYSGGGAYLAFLYTSPTLLADDTDWGVGGTENLPDDVASPSISVGYYQAASSFECTVFACD